MKKRYEYKKVTDLKIKKLNKLGAKGWELPPGAYEWDHWDKHFKGVIILRREITDCICLIEPLT